SRFRPLHLDANKCLPLKVSWDDGLVRPQRLAIARRGATATLLVSMSGVWIAPAYADPPAPVSSVTVEPDGPQYVKVSWTGQDPNATGVRVCAKLGGSASVNPADCDDAQDR